MQFSCFPEDLDHHLDMLFPEFLVNFLYSCDQVAIFHGGVEGCLIQRLMLQEHLHINLILNHKSPFNPWPVI